MYSIEEIYFNAKKSNSLEEFCKKYGGRKVYIPQVRPDYKERIQQEFNGYNKEVLATKYNVTVSTVEDIVRALKVSKFTQKSLF